MHVLRIVNDPDVLGLAGRNRHIFQGINFPEGQRYCPCEHYPSSCLIDAALSLRQGGKPGRGFLVTGTRFES